MREDDAVRDEAVREDEAGRSVAAGVAGERVGVLRANQEFMLVASAEVPTGQQLFAIDGELTRTPSRYSLQVGWDLHLDLPDGCTEQEIMDRYFWRFMNHSCAPNARVVGRQVVAARDIAPGEQIRFHYNTTEYEMAEPFRCTCGASSCAGVIAGYSALDQQQREALRPWLAEHLRAVEPAGPAEAHR